MSEIAHMSKLEGKVAVVTGASKGIGAGIAKALAQDGAAVVVNYASSRAGADAVVAAITSAGGRAIAVQGDVSKASEAQGVIDNWLARTRLQAEYTRRTRPLGECPGDDDRVPHDQATLSHRPSFASRRSRPGRSGGRRLPAGRPLPPTALR